MAILTDLTTAAGRARALANLQNAARAKNGTGTTLDRNIQTALANPDKVYSYTGTTLNRPSAPDDVSVPNSQVTVGDIGSPTPRSQPRILAPTQSTATVGDIGSPTNKTASPYQTFSNNTTAIDSFNPDFSSARTNIGTTGTRTIDTSTPEEITSLNRSITNRVENIAGLGKKQVSKEDIARIGALRPENQYEKDLATGVGMVKDYAMGNSQIDRTIANRLLNRFDASQGAASLAQAQRIASNPLLSEGGKQAAQAEAQRMAGSQRAELTGQLAQQSQERAFTAADKYTQLAQTAAQYNETKFQNDFKNVTDEINREIDTLSKAGTLELGQLGQSVDMWSKRIDSMQSDAARALSAAVAIGQIDQKEADLRLDKIKEQTRMKEKEFEINLDAKRTDANSRQIDETISNLRETRAETQRTRAYGAVSDWQMLNPRNDGESADDYAARMYNSKAMAPIIKDAYYAETGQTGPVDLDWVEAYMAQHPDPASFESKSSESYRKNLVRTLSGYGMSPEAATNVANTIALGASTDGMVSINATGDYVYDDGTNRITFGKDGIPKFEDSTPELGSVVAAFKNKPEGYITEIDGVVYKNSKDGPKPVVVSEQFPDKKPGDVVSLGGKSYKITPEKTLLPVTIDVNSQTSLWGADATSIMSDKTNPLYNSILSNRVESIKKDMKEGNFARLEGLDQTSEVYKNVAASIAKSEIGYHWSGKGLLKTGAREFNFTKIGDGGIIKSPNGTLWTLTKDTGISDYAGKPSRYVYMYNPSTGKRVKFYAGMPISELDK